MTNAIIDALEWDPDHPAASVRALQTALMSLQEEWNALIPPFGQISRNGLVYESDWNIFESDRADATFLHFDHETPDFRNEWANIFGQLQSVNAPANSGRSKFYSASVSSNRVALASTTGTVITVTFTLSRPAKLHIFFPIMINAISGSVTLLNLKIDTVSLYSWVPQGIPTGSWKYWYVIANSGEYAVGSHTVLLEATTAAGTGEFAQLTPLPSTVSGTPAGIITPSLAYVEAIYQ